MQIQLILARNALGNMEISMDRHADLQCKLGNWRSRLAAASDQVISHLRWK